MEINPVTIGEYPLHNCIGKSRTADKIMPFVDNKLAGYNHRTCTATIIKNLKQVLFLHIGQRRQPPVIDGNDIGFGEFCKHPIETSIRIGNSQTPEELGRRNVTG